MGGVDALRAAPQFQVQERRREIDGAEPEGASCTTIGVVLSSESSREQLCSISVEGRGGAENARLQQRSQIELVCSSVWHCYQLAWGRSAARFWISRRWKDCCCSPCLVANVVQVKSTCGFRPQMLGYQHTWLTVTLELQDFEPSMGLQDNQS